MPWGPPRSHSPGREADRDRDRGGRGLRRHRPGERAGRAGGAEAPARRAVAADDRGGALVPGPVARRGASPGCAGGGDGRGGGAGRRGCGRGGQARADARRVTARGGPRRAVRIRRPARGRRPARTLRRGPADALSALRSFTLRVGRPLRPMLAAAAPTIAAALQKVSPAAVEWKIDGIRVQAHKDGSSVAVFTRTLDDITARVPEIAEAVLALPRRGGRAGRRGGRAVSRRAAAAVPGHRQPGGHPDRGGVGARRRAAHPVLLRPAAPGRRRT